MDIKLEFWKNPLPEKIDNWENGLKNYSGTYNPKNTIEDICNGLETISWQLSMIYRKIVEEK